jgi:hypothetical protein
MATSYYYLLSALPNLKDRDNLTSEVLNDALETIRRNIYEKDRTDFRFLLHRLDNLNLIHHISRTYKNRYAPPHSAPRYISASELYSRVGEGVALPDYLEFFALDQREKLTDLSESEISHLLWGYFIEDCAKKCKPETVYVITYENRIRQEIHRYFNPAENAYEDSQKPLLVKGVEPSDTAEKDHRGIRELWKALEENDLGNIDILMAKVVYRRLTDSSYSAPYSWSHLMHYTLQLMMTYRITSIAEDIDQQYFTKVKDRILENAYPV